MLVWNAGIVSTEDALSGYSNPGVLAVGSLFVVIKGVERSRLADRAAKHVFGLRTSFTAGLLRLMGLAFFLSAFLNNTPVVALLIPITKDWATTRGFSASLLLMPLSYACIFGGLITIIGTSTNLVVQGLVIEADLPGLGFFEPGYIGLPLGVVGMLYLAVAAPRVLARPEGGRGGGGGGGGAGCDRGRAEELLTEVITWRCWCRLPRRVRWNSGACPTQTGVGLVASLSSGKRCPKNGCRLAGVRYSARTSVHRHYVISLRVCFQQQ